MHPYPLLVNTLNYDHERSRHQVMMLGLVMFKFHTAVVYDEA